MRILVTGMGGELGTRVTNELEAAQWVEAIAGIDADPPRRGIGRATFHLLEPADRDGIVEAVRSFEPTAVVHLGVFEPHARFGAGASARSRDLSVAALGAAAELGSVERIVVRSGVEVYGRARGRPVMPDETVRREPSSAWGRDLTEAESLAQRAGRAADAPVTCLRFAPVVGPHFPSPLGRYLRLPVVAVSALGELPFSVLHQEDAAAAIVRALEVGYDGYLNYVGPGAVTASQAVRLGGRLPVPIMGPAWTIARAAAELLGAPLPDHVRELLIRGRCADGGLADQVLDMRPARSTPEVVRELFEWAPVSYLDLATDAAA